MERPLNIREQSFAKEMAAGSTGSQAVIAAGYHPSTDASARALASELSHKAKIREEIDRIRYAKIGDAEKVFDAMISIVLNEKTEARDRVAAGKEVLSRVGFSASVESLSDKPTSGQGKRVTNIAQAVINQVYKS